MEAAPEARGKVRALGEELVEVLKSSGIKVSNIPQPERDKLKQSSKLLHKKAIKLLGGDSQRIYDLILKGKVAFKEKTEEKMKEKKKKEKKKKSSS